MDNIVFIVGPTSSGKTPAAYLLARCLNAQIVSCDSMLIYNEPRIITSAPSDEMLRNVPHHFVRFVSVENSYSVFDYCRAAAEKIKYLFEKNIPVIVCGGSGLYVKSILDGIFEGSGRDDDFRWQLERKAMQNGKQHLFAELEKIDPESAKIISPNDLKRIIRALEVYHCSGVSLSQKKLQARGLYGKLPIKVLGLRGQRNNLYQRINRRVDEMFEQGAVDEVRGLLKLNLSLTASKIIGIKEIFSFLKGERDEESAKEMMKRNTRRFAKRQITWFKADKRISWIDIDNWTPAQVSDAILNRIKEV